VTQTIASIDEIADRYDAVLCDVWGVLHNGRTAYPAACAALQRLKRAGKHVILITNVPKPRGPIPGQLDRAGVPRDAWDAIVTSGDAIRAELATRAPGPMFKIGPDDYDRTLWEGLNLKQAPLSEAAFFAISGLNRDDETPADYVDVLREAKAHNLDLICANPDIIVDFGDKRLYCAGALAEAYEKIGGTALFFGKPHPPIYDLARRRLSLLTDGTPQILAIGDGISTDIQGGMAEDIDTLFVTGGIAADSFGADAENPDPALLDAWLAKKQLSVTFAIGRLR